MMEKGENNFYVYTKKLSGILETIENTGLKNYRVHNNYLISMHMKIQEAVFYWFSFFLNNFLVYTWVHIIIIYKENKKIRKVRK